MSKTISEIVDLASAFYGSAVLFSALDNGIFEAVENSGGCADAKKIAESKGLSLRGVTLLMDACVAEGLLEKDGEVYSNTDAGKMALVPGAAADLSNAVKYNRDVYPLWGRLNDFVKTGCPVEPPKVHLGDDLVRTKAFALAMRSRAFAIGRSVVPMIDLKGCSRLLDLAGGPGAYAQLLVKANPGLTCVTVDVPGISSVAKECIEEAGLYDLIECRKGDYHTDEYESESYDAVTIFGALHQESPSQICDILMRANRALKKGGRLFVLDMMTDSTHTNPPFSALFGLNMALSTDNGWVFSDEELKGWMREARFTPGETQAVRPPMPHWLVSAVKE